MEKCTPTRRHKCSFMIFNLVLTVQLLKETPAVLSLGKLCEDHGYSYEWVSGQKPRLTKDGKSIISKTDNFVPLVVPGLSAKLGSVSSSTSPPHDSLRREVEVATGNSKRSVASSSSSVLMRSDGRVQRNTELPASAHSSQESDLEHPTKVATQSRKHSTFSRKT